MLITADNMKEWMEAAVYTRRGHRVQIIAALAAPNALIGGRTVVAMYEVGDHEYALNSWYANGQFYPGDRADELDLVLGQAPA